MKTKKEEKKNLCLKRDKSWLRVSLAVNKDIVEGSESAAYGEQLHILEIYTRVSS